ncbi:MAG: amidohydrolase family protein, partial [Pseudomonadota bacterium]
VESNDQFMHDLERLTKTFHQTNAGAMRQIVAAPCQPMNCSENTFIEAAVFAREHGLQLHTHMGEGESEAMLARYGKRSLAWLEDIGFVGDDVWVAHAWDVELTEIDRLADTQTGVSHCPLPVMLVGEGVTDVSAMLSAGVRVGLGVDGCASNDASNLAECIRHAFLLQCLVATERGYAAPDPRDYLRVATQGGASLLGRKDLGMLQPGACADLFVVRQDKVEHTGAWHAPESLPAKLGLASDVHLTMIDGRIVWRDNQFPGYDEAQLAAAAHAQFSELLLS